MEKAKKHAISNTRFDNRRTWSLLKSENMNTTKRWIYLKYKQKHGADPDPGSRETQARRFQTFARKLLLNQWVSSHLETHKNSNSSALFCKKKSWIKLACLICIILAYWNWNWNHLTAGRQTNGFVLVRSVCKSFRSSLSQASGRTAYDSTALLCKQYTYTIRSIWSTLSLFHWNVLELS